MNDIKLTIGIPSIPSRMRMGLEPLFAKLQSQIGERKDVEVISLMDNKLMSIGRKKQLLLQIARGKYTCIIDDDDDISSNFVYEICEAIQNNDGVDVICYDQEAIIEGVSYLVTTDINHPKNPPFEQLPQHPKNSLGEYVPCKRPPWQWCSWNTEFCNKFKFGDSNWGEDSFFVENALKEVKTQYKINKILHIYKWSSKTSEAPFIANQVNIPVRV